MRENQLQRPYQRDGRRAASPLRIDMAGERIGMLTVVGFAGIAAVGKAAVWKCRCDCGKTVLVKGYDLRQGRKYSCGCAGMPSFWKPETRFSLKQLIRTLNEKEHGRKKRGEPENGGNLESRGDSFTGQETRTDRGQGRKEEMK